jgi:poly-gamma-glutamate synthesis protein (capsule biosynthesis protein)
MEKKRLKIIIIILSGIFLIASIGFTALAIKNYQKSKTNNDTTESTLGSIPTAPALKETKIYFVGDIMLDRGVLNSVNKNFNGNFSELFRNVPELKNADILFGNLEGPVSNTGNNVGSKYSFRMSPSVLLTLKDVGFNIFSFANNHVGDWNVAAFNDTLNRFKENNFFVAGAGIDKKQASIPTVIEKNGIHFGFLGFSDVGPNWMEAKENKPGILLASDPNFSSIVKSAKENVDVLIVSIHFGEEYEEVHNKKQEKLAHMAIDSGADMIIGHHPHVIQDIEYYNEKPIIYSLGNFIFDQYFSKETMRGLVVMATFEGEKLKELKSLISLQNKKYQIEGLYEKDKIEDALEASLSNCPKPVKSYNDMSLLNIGQKIGLSDIKYVPKNLVELGDLSTNKNFCLVQEAKKALQSMVNEALKEGLKIKATSAFRDYSTQENIYKNALLYASDADKSVAKPGHSEHQLGTTIDLSGSTTGYSSANVSFDNTPEELWLRENAHKYGFIMSYPYLKEDITGYKYEPWHYRYVGIDLAKKIKDSGLTLTEYLK